MVYKIRVLEEVDFDIYDKHSGDFDCDECFDGSSFC